jgi:hypothetical protein
MERGLEGKREEEKRCVHKNGRNEKKQDKQGFENLKKEKQCYFVILSR